MALRTFNSVGGFSVGEVPTTIILANGDITTTNITTTGVSNLNSIGNVKISGGTNGQVIQTDGSGNLSFVTISTSTLSNGNSNIQIYANGNIALSSNGVANVVVITSTREIVNGTLSITGNVTAGNVNAGNLLTASYVAGTLTTASQPNITSVGTLTALSVSGNANIGNIGTAGIITATGNVTGGNLTTGGVVSATGNVTSNNLVAGNIAYANNFIVVGSTITEGGQFVLGYVGINNITGQANGKWNMDVDNSNNFRIFTQYANSTASQIGRAHV